MQPNLDDLRRERDEAKTAYIRACRRVDWMKRRMLRADDMGEFERLADMLEDYEQHVMPDIHKRFNAAETDYRRAGLI